MTASLLQFTIPSRFHDSQSATRSFYTACRLAYDPDFLDFLHSNILRVHISLPWMCISLIESFLKLSKMLCIFYGSKFGARVMRHVTPCSPTRSCDSNGSSCGVSPMEGDRFPSHSHHRLSCSAPDRYLSILTILQSMVKQRLQDGLITLAARRMPFDTEAGRVTMASTTRLPCKRPLGTIP